MAKNTCFTAHVVLCQNTLLVGATRFDAIVLRVL